MASRVVLATWKSCPQGIMPSIMACRSKIFCNSAFNAFGNVVRRLWVGARILDWHSEHEVAARADENAVAKLLTSCRVSHH